MAKEIEKKYLLSSRPAGLIKGSAIRQGYLAAGDPEVRVRSKGAKFFLTRKGGEGFVREEEELEITAQMFGILWPLTAGARIEKIRYAVKATDGLVWEVDEYRGKLTGMYTAEVELPSEDFQPVFPDAIAVAVHADVTTDARFKNKNLASRRRA